MLVVMIFHYVERCASVSSYVYDNETRGTKVNVGSELVNLYPSAIMKLRANAELSNVTVVLCF